MVLSSFKKQHIHIYAYTYIHIYIKKGVYKHIGLLTCNTVRQSGQSNGNAYTQSIAIKWRMAAAVADSILLHVYMYTGSF